MARVLAFSLVIGFQHTHMHTHTQVIRLHITFTHLYTPWSRVNLKKEKCKPGAFLRNERGGCSNSARHAKIFLVTPPFANTHAL